MKATAGLARSISSARAGRVAAKPCSAVPYSRWTWAPLRRASSTAATRLAAAWAPGRITTMYWPWMAVGLAVASTATPGSSAPATPAPAVETASAAAVTASARRQLDVDTVLPR